jgi:hypothetical protein
VLAQGDEAEGLALWRAVQAGGRFSDYRAAFAELGYGIRGPQRPRLAPPAQPSVVPALSRRAREASSKQLPLVS